MRILVTEQKWGVVTPEGVPIAAAVVERWQSLDKALAETISEVIRQGHSYVVRWFPDRTMVEIDISDPDDTLIGLWDAADLERKTGVSAMQALTVMVKHGPELERFALTYFPELKKGIKQRRKK